ncbi:recombination protein RecR [bacterium]|jgi:recombination protein RecR|nr:recombination protein RecR [bacterium]
MEKNPLDGLMTQLTKFPGVGQKSAQRMAFFLLSIPGKDVHSMASTMVDTRQRIRYCERCFNISFEKTCSICEDSNRDRSLLCVVSEPKDIFAIERAGQFKGNYHVLGGLISPIDGILPESLRIKELIERLKSEPLSEVIFAINPTIEGDATILYLTKILASFETKLSSLAYGLPVGSDMDYADELTLQKAFQGRQGL